MKVTNTTSHKIGIALMIIGTFTLVINFMIPFWEIYEVKIEKDDVNGGSRRFFKVHSYNGIWQACVSFKHTFGCQRMNISKRDIGACNDCLNI